MRRFAFRLEKVLELRRYREREWELKLAEVTSRVMGVEREIEQWLGRRQTTAGVSSGPGPVDMDEWRSREGYAILIDDRIRELRSRLVMLEAERDKVRERYLVVSSRRKALTRLKERRSDEYYGDALKDEHRAVDELAGSKAVRRTSGPEGDDV
jgi:flagellar protein FliJ